MNDEDLEKAKDGILTIMSLLDLLKAASEFQEHWGVYEIACILEEKAETLNEVLTC